ncbi:D-alanyl-D-alanine carboxypeptidase [Clostridium sp. AM58-1XD]|nr:D-alanyl-D-alanine carboxypeptidase family protein [Clostridium sp. AM58-1XD]RGZ00712.1 D-alanyl-D-alanine carboxypeptidase [Clostridium sp. AM58-1XD]
MVLNTVFPAYAKPEWPSDTGVQSEAGIVMDMDSGAVLFAQNIHEQKAPASITKLLTALVVVERANLDDMVTFSNDAVYNVEGGSGNKLNIEEGDKLTVRDCLYLMLLQSSNQAANALAEHVAGSRDAFVELMNQKLQELGCTESHFANPSGLNDDTQLTTAYDMALIGAAAFANPVLLEIDSTKKYSIPATINNPNGRTFEMEHKLVVTEDTSSENYYPAAVAGKTGYTSIAGQTLVTYAKQDDRRLIAVTLKSTQKTHYSDTKTLLDFGFRRFQNVNISENETSYVTGEEALSAEGESFQPSELYIDKSAVISLPKEASFSDAEKTLVTELPDNHPEQAVARIDYTYNERKIGSAWIYTTREMSAEAANQGDGDGQESKGQDDGQTPSAEGEDGKNPNTANRPAVPMSVMIIGGIVVLCAVLAAGGFFWYRKKQEQERERQRIRREKRRRRLEEMGCSQEEFERMMNERKSQKSGNPSDE